MTFDPVQRFLGVESGAPPAELLALSETPLSHLAIDEALRRRLAEVYNHPDGRSDEAEDVRRILREAAAALKSQLPRTAGHVQPRIIARAPLPALTEFDRSVLAILIGSGGWNATSRGRLIALAGAHNVTVHGLFRIVAGLGGYARRARLQPPLAAAGRVRAASQTPPPASTAAPKTEAEEEEEARSHVWRTVKLSLLFGLIAMVLAAFAVNQLAPRIERARPADSQAAAGPAQPPVEAPPEIDDTEESPDEPEKETYEHINWGIASFGPDQPATFHAPTPDAAIAARSACDTAIDELDNLINRINISDADGPAEMVHRIWEEVLDHVASAWVLLDEPALRSIERMMIDALFASAGRANVSAYERLITAMDPPASSRISEPLDVWRGAWRAGMLARVAFHADLPSGVVEFARARLNVALDRRPGEDARLTFSQAAALWLDRAEPQLIARLAEHDRAFAAWEMWIVAQKRLGPHERASGAMLTAIRAILLSDHALLTDDDATTPALAVVGRLLDEADFNASRRVYEQFLAMMDDDAIDSRDLWILTSLLARSAHAGWYDDSFVLSTPDANVRRRLRQDIAAAWPRSAVAVAPGDRLGRSQLDAEAAEVKERWLRLVERLERSSIEMSGEEALLNQVLHLAQLSEAAAYFEARTPMRAERLLDEIDQSSASEPAGPRPSRSERAGRPSGTEGGWSTAYEESRRDMEERTRLLRALRASAGGDLWPADAAIVVREAYRGAPPEIRNIAQGVIAEAFMRGPNVSRELLDQLPDVQRTPQISEFLSRHTGRSLPARRDQEWVIAARLALIEHLLGLLHGGAPAIETIADDLGGSYAKAAGALIGLEPHQSPAAAAPAHGAAALYDLWRERAHAHGASRLGGELAAADRRHAARMRMAEGPIQETIALRIGTLELMAIATRGEAATVSAAGAGAGGGVGSGGGGGFDRHLAHILDTHARQWRTAPSAILQALWVERAINAVWRVRMNVPEDIAYFIEPGPMLDEIAAHLNSLQLVTLIFSPHIRAQTAEDRWAARLAALDPSKPLAYFELAEEIADVEQSAAAIALAKRLFALAGALDPDRIGRSACLALADLEDQPHVKRRYLALADLLNQRHAGPRGSVSPDNGGEDSPERRAAALALTEAFSHYRQGNGTRAAQILRRDEVAALLHSIETALPWRNAQTFVSEVSVQRRRPSVTEAAFVRMLQIEQFLLGAGPIGSAGWATELTFTGGRPLIEVDPERLDEALGVDVTRPLYREGRWVEMP